VDTSPIFLYPYATANTAGVVKVDGTTLININNSGTIGVNYAALPISTLTNGTYTVSLTTAGMLVLPGNVELGLNIEGDPNGVDLYSPDTNDYISMTYGPTPSNGFSSYLFFKKESSTSSHYLGVQVWNGNTSTSALTEWDFHSNGSLSFPDGSNQTTAWNTATNVGWGQITGGPVRNITQIDSSMMATYNATATDEIVVVSSLGVSFPVTVNLPIPSIYGKAYTIKKLGITPGGTVTINVNPGSFDGIVTSIAITSDYGYLTVVGDGTVNYFIINQSL
jgi:hypothetical protein